jgi:hypothetical protein
MPIIKMKDLKDGEVAYQLLDYNPTVETHDIAPFIHVDVGRNSEFPFRMLGTHDNAWRHSVSDVCKLLKVRR